MALLRLFFVAALAVALSGCAAPLVILPDDIGHQGLLVAKVASPDMADLEKGDPLVGGRKFISGMRRGYVVIPLDPGEHTLESLNVFQTSVPYGVPGVNYSVTYPINRNFKIEQGKATNLGLLVFMAGPKGTMRYYMFALDNSDEMSTFLQETHPKLYRSLKDTTPVPSGPFLDPAKTGQLREAIAVTLLKERKQLNPADGYIAGPAGTLARIKRDKAGNAVDLVVLSTGTFADLSACSVGTDRAVCMKSTQEYLLAKGESVTTLKVPEGVTGNSIHTYRDRLVLIDSSMNIYDSRDDGRSWTKYSGVAWKEPLGYEYYRPDQKNRFAFLNGRQGYYIYSPSMAADKAPLMYYDYASAAYRNLALPARAERVEAVRETEAGLFIAPIHTEFSKGKVHFLPAGKTTWEARETPEAGCKRLLAADGSGREIQILCKRENVWKSTNGGVNWERIFKKDSLFKDEA